MTGCSSTNAPNRLSPNEISNLLSEETPIYLSQDESRSQLRDFVDGRQSFFERDKIHYLLSRIRESKVHFVRNGIEYNGFIAVQWLRWKTMHHQFRHEPIDTARKFVDRVCQGSIETGIPYEIILADGRRAPLRMVLSHELNLLEAAIREKTVPLNQTTELEPAPKPQRQITEIPLMSAAK